MLHIVLLHFAKSYNPGQGTKQKSPFLRISILNFIYYYSIHKEKRKIFSNNKITLEQNRITETCSLVVHLLLDTNMYYYQKTLYRSGAIRDI